MIPQYRCLLQKKFLKSSSIGLKLTVTRTEATERLKTGLFSRERFSAATAVQRFQAQTVRVGRECIITINETMQRKGIVHRKLLPRNVLKIW